MQALVLVTFFENEPGAAALTTARLPESKTYLATYTAHVSRAGATIAA
jgi:hypothetical protein